MDSGQGTVATLTLTPAPEVRAAVPVRGRVDVVDVTASAGDVELLHHASLSVRSGELVALAGGSGTGKTTLLQTMAGLRRPTSGAVLHGGHPATRGAADIGFVPQDDIIHRGLPLRRTLWYAARLRLPAGTSRDEIDRIVDDTLRDLELTDRGDVLVGSLSGGQRKRASIAVELLTRPRILFLDEPTSGLDPATSAEVLAVLHRLAECGVTVVLTTHDPVDIDACDRVVFLARHGHVAFVGSPDDARRAFEVADLAHVYQRLADEETPAFWAERFARGRTPESPPSPVANVPVDRSARVGTVSQSALLARRSVELLYRSPLTLAVLLGSPVLVISMMAVLFRPGGFGGAGPGELGPVQTIFWIAFAGFFFGLTYGLLQIVGEFSVLRRERLAGLNLLAYVGSKLVVLLPLLTVVNLTMLAVLRGALDRLPDAGARTYALLLAVLVVESFCALGLGLLTSAAVSDAAQATLALPMLCFPQVLFAGAVVPVIDMAAPGRAISVAMANRWAFEALGRGLEADRVHGIASGTTRYSDAFSGSPLLGCAILAVLGVAFVVATVAVLTTRTRRWR